MYLHDTQLRSWKESYAWKNIVQVKGEDLQGRMTEKDEEEGKEKKAEGEEKDEGDGEGFFFFLFYVRNH